MSVVAKLVREPLTHFLLIGTLVFIAYAMMGGSQPDAPERIVVTDGRVQQLVQVFAKTRRRPPTLVELQGLINAYVKEEVYYREALKLGLDRNDTLIRRRLQQKMEFLTEPNEPDLQASDDDLQKFLAAHRSEFRVAPKVAFRQIFLKQGNGKRGSSQRAEQVLKALRSDANPDELGDNTLLPSQMPLTSLDLVARNFGYDFAEALLALPQAQWTGPVQSAYGLHVVRVTARKEGYDPPLKEIRRAVQLKWRFQRRKAWLTSEYERLRSKYEVVLPSVEPTASAARSASQ